MFLKYYSQNEKNLNDYEFESKNQVPDSTQQFICENSCEVHYNYE